MSQMSRQLDPVAELESFSTGSQRQQSSSPKRENEQQGEHHHHKKSLFSKMKDKAKKLQHSLSAKKRHDDEESDGTMSPPFGKSEDHHNEVREGGYTSLSPHDKSKDSEFTKEEEETEEDPEYLGAPMYESKKAPEELKKTARQHPRETPLISETNVLSVLPSKQKDCTEDHMISEKNIVSDSDNKTVTESSEKTGKECTSHEPNSPSKTVTDIVTETLAPAYAKVSDATNTVTQKLKDMAFPESTEPKETNTQSTRLDNKVWDKGVSMKEYISQKFEPSEDDKELSRVISKAISPRKASSSSQGASFGGATNMVAAPNSSDNRAPLLANTNEIVEEENHGRILQPN